MANKGLGPGGQDLPGVHDALGIESLLDAPHGINANIPKLSLEEANLSSSDAMLSSAGASHLQGPGSHAVRYLLANLVLLWLLGVKEKEDVEVAITNMSQNRTYSKKGFVTVSSQVN